MQKKLERFFYFFSSLSASELPAQNVWTDADNLWLLLVYGRQLSVSNLLMGITDINRLNKLV